MSLAAIAESGPAGAAVAGLNAIEVRRSGKPTANAVAFRSPPPRMGLFPVDFTSDYTFHEERVRRVSGPWQLEDDNRNYRSCNSGRPADSNSTD